MLSTASAFAQYTIQSSVIGAGGGPASNSTYSMNGTIGQSVVGTINGSQYSVGQGFWHSLNFTNDVKPPVRSADGYSLEQNYPNPFNPSTTIVFSIPERQKVTLRIMNLLGEVVAKPIDGESLDAGTYQYEYQALGIPSGTYIYRLEAGNFVKSRKMVLTK